MPRPELLVDQTADVVRLYAHGHVMWVDKDVWRDFVMAVKAGRYDLTPPPKAA